MIEVDGQIICVCTHAEPCGCDRVDYDVSALIASLSSTTE